jgi:WD40 repeat protein
MEKIKVLLFAANPTGTEPLDLPREYREIQEEIRIGDYRDALDLVLVPGARPVDLLRKLNETRPQIVHFSGHGSADAALILEGDEDTAMPPPSATTRSASDRDMRRVWPAKGERPPATLSRWALAEVLRSCDQGNIRVVVLNACHSRIRAEAVAEVTDFVISMNRAISDRAAAQFAASFYGALAFGRSVQKAFEQGVARLAAEGVGEAEVPELLARRGSDPAQAFLVGGRAGEGGPTPSGGPTLAAPFSVPFPRNPDFVGRDEDLARLHASLSGSGPVGIRPAGLTGMGGIGKTQLAVEYAYRYRFAYPGGTFWINAAEPPVEGLAALGRRLRPDVADDSSEDQVRAAFEVLARRPDALLVLDNLADLSELLRPIAAGCGLSGLPCRVLFTTRRRDLGRFTAVEVTVLPEGPALRLLLRHPARQAILEPQHPQHEHARVIGRMLGRLPLALELAGAFLGEWAEIPLADYRERLKREGVLATLDDEAAQLSPADLPAIHDAAVTATLTAQWEVLRDETARHLLRVAAQFPEGAEIPGARLGLLAGAPDHSQPGHPSPLARALRRLEDTCLAEEMIADELRLHPLVREFAIRQIPRTEFAAFRRQCAERLADSYAHYATLEEQAHRRGIDAIQQDFIVALDLCPRAEEDEVTVRLRRLFRILQREAHLLRSWDPSTQPVLFAQQIRNQASDLGLPAWYHGARQRLLDLRLPHAALTWRASSESPALVRTLLGHEGGVNAVALTPDGHRVISASADRTLKLWDLQTGQLLRTFAGHEGPVNAVAPTPDGRFLVSASHDRTLKIWDLMNGRPVRTLAGHRGRVSAMVVTPDGRYALSGSLDGTLKLWDLATGVAVLGRDEHSRGVSALTLTPDGRCALSGSTDGTLTFLALDASRAHGPPDVRYRTDDTPKPLVLDTWRELRNWAEHPCGVGALAMTPDGAHALAGYTDGSLKLWDIRSGWLRLSFLGHSDWIAALAVTPDGRSALSGADDATLKLWDFESGQEIRTFSGHAAFVRAVAIHPDGRHALSGSDDQTLKIWDVERGQELQAAPGHTGRVNAVAVTPDGRHALSGADDRTLKLWDLATGEELWTRTAHESPVAAVAVLSEGRRALSGSYDGTIRLWHMASGQELTVLKGHVGGLRSVAVTRDCGHALAGSAGGTLQLWDLAAGTMIQLFAAHADQVTALAWTIDRRFALSASNDSTIKLWDVPAESLIRTFYGHSDLVTSLALLPDGHHAVSTSADRTLKLWDVRDGQVLLTLAGHGARVNVVAIGPDGRLLLSGSDDRTVKLWDLHTGRCLANVPIDGSPTGAAITPDGTSAVIGDKAGNIYGFRLVGFPAG